MDFWLSLVFIADSKNALTDEEKQRERQRNEREIKNAEQEAYNYRVSNLDHVVVSRSQLCMHACSPLAFLFHYTF